MHGENISYAYGFWSLVVVNVALFAFFILSFLIPLKKESADAMAYDYNSLHVSRAPFCLLPLVKEGRK